MLVVWWPAIGMLTRVAVAGVFLLQGHLYPIPASAAAICVYEIPSLSFAVQARDEG